MRQTALLFLIAIMAAAVAIGQTSPSTSVSLLGAHNISGRGCLGCHPPSSGTSTAETGFGLANAGAAPPWGPSTLPLYGKAFAFGDGGRYVEVLPTNISTRDREVNGILVCLSCHDGNLTPPSMMAGQSFEQRIGLLTNSAYGSQPIPTLLGPDSYANDHPVGTAAVIHRGQGLVWVNNTFIVTPGSRYAQFVANYGRPALAPGRWSNPWGVNSSGEPFILCTTCHNQHVMTVYTSTPSSPIAGDGGGRFYSTLFFINAPYNPNLNNARNTNAISATQFCRQCHFGESNEANNSNTVPTILPSY